MSSDGGAPRAAPATSGHGVSPPPKTRGASPLKLVVGNGFLEVKLADALRLVVRQDVEPDINRALDVGDFCQSSVGRPSRVGDIASLAPSSASLPNSPWTATTSMQDGHGSVGRLVGEGNYDRCDWSEDGWSRGQDEYQDGYLDEYQDELGRRFRRPGQLPLVPRPRYGSRGQDESGWSRAGSAAHQDEPTSLATFTGRGVGSDLEGRYGTAAQSGELTGLAASSSHIRGNEAEGRGPRHSGQVELATAQWSQGTVWHDTGNCKPCNKFNARVGCANGVNCMYCHAPHEKKKRVRPGKATRAP